MAKVDERFNSLDEFTQGYVTALIYYRNKFPDDYKWPTDIDPNKYANIAFADIPHSTLKKIKEHTAHFQDKFAELLNEIYNSLNFSKKKAGRAYYEYNCGRGMDFDHQKINHLGAVTQLRNELNNFKPLDFAVHSDGSVYLRIKKIIIL